MTEEPATTYHLLPRAIWLAHEPDQDYRHESLDREGFIHCTDDPVELAAVGNRYYRAIPGEFVALVLDRARLKASVRYDDPGHLFPHVYGPVNREAIARVVVVPRTADGTFLPIEEDDAG